MYNPPPNIEPADPDVASVERETPPVPTAPAESTSDKGTIVDSIIAGDTLMTNVHRAMGQLRDKAYRGASAAMQTPEDVCMSEVLKSDDPRATSPEMEAACQSEADGLVTRGAFRRRLRTSVPPHANVLGGRMVKVIKRVNTADASAKARFVAQGNTDKAKAFVVHNLSALRQSSTKILVSTSAVLGFRIFSHDVNQAYLQSKDKLSREVFVRPRARDARYFGVRDDEVLQVLLPLYGLPDAGDYWDVTVLDHVENELGMEPLVGDPRLFVKDGSNALQGLLGGCVDDFLMGGDTYFQTLTEKTLQRSESKPRVWDNMEFIGVSIKTAPGPPRVLSIDQTGYIDAARKLPLSISYDKFVSLRAAFAWLAHSRPDLCCAINRAAQVTASTFRKEHIKELNKAIKHANATKTLSLMYAPLDKETLHLLVYADASFASNDDLSSQLGYIVLLCDGHSRCHVMTYSSRKSRRVVKSIMAGEVYAFADAFDAAFIIKHDLERIYDQHLPLVMLTDSKQMFDVITRASHTTKKRLMIDVAAAREAYKRYEISNVGLVRSEHNPADGLTKPPICPALDATLCTGRDVNPVKQWVTRNETMEDSATETMTTAERTDGRSGEEDPGV